LIEHPLRPIVNSIEAEEPLENEAGSSGQSWKENAMSILSSIGRIATRYSVAHARYRTERSIRSLPLELQKDIGWPEVADCVAHNERGTARKA
jgi:hypothetical protein